MKDEKRHKYDDPEQSARFIELGDQLLEDDAEEKLEEAMKRIAAAKRHKTEKSSTKA